MLCDSGEVEDVLHLLVLCEEFHGRGRKIGDIEGSDVWLEEFDGADNVTKMALMLGTVMERIDNVIMIRGTEAVAEEERASVLSPNPEVGNGSTSDTSSISDTSNTLATYQT